MAGWYQLGKTDLIFAYGKTGSTFMSGLHNAGRISRPKCNIFQPAETMPSGMRHELKTWPVKSTKDIIINLVIRHPLDRFVSALYMIMNDLFNHVLFKGTTYGDNSELFDKLWLDESWWQQSISGFLKFQGTGNLQRKHDYTRMLDRLDRLDTENGCIGLRGEEFDLFKFIFLDPDHEYHVGNYMHNFLCYEDYMLNIIELNSLDYFLNSKLIDTSDIFRYSQSESQQRTFSDTDKDNIKLRYNAFKTGFYKNDLYELIYEYVLPDIHMYNNFMNFGYDNIQHVYNNNEKHLRK